MRDAVLREELPSIDKLDDPRCFPYRWGQAFWAYVAGRYGDEIVGQILNEAGRAGSAEGAILGSSAGVWSRGVSLRFNAFGYAIGQFSYVKANHRPLKPWMWEFSLTPGF